MRPDGRLADRLASYMPDLNFENPRVQHARRRFDGYQQRLIIGSGDALNRKQVEVGIQVKFLLPALTWRTLLEPTALVVMPCTSRVFSSLGLA